jgi:NAD(P)-dependent dehydrogenase (short-subunit alcohol dehydrogenase family)
MRIKLGKYYITKSGIHPIVNNFRDPSSGNKTEGDSLAGKVALITGGYKGIGLAITKSFLREGARVIMAGRNRELMEKVCHNLQDANVSCMRWDIADKAVCLSLLHEAFNVFGTIDILVNNAGINRIDKKAVSFFNATDDSIFRMHTINVMGTRNICENYIKVIGGDKGKIINIVSNTAFLAPYGADAYWLSKWALCSYTKALGSKYKDRIIVNGIAPGPTKTDMVWKAGQSIIMAGIPNGRIGLPEEVAELAVMLAGKKGDLISGKVILCDGGQVLA